MQKRMVPIRKPDFKTLVEFWTPAVCILSIVLERILNVVVLDSVDLRLQDTGNHKPNLTTNVL